MVTGTPRMVTDGLVLYLDAANTKSYPGSGTVWTDLSSTRLTGSLTNGPTFTSNRNGAIQFDGTNDFVDFGNRSEFAFTNGVLSVECWLYVSSSWTAGGQYPNLVSKGAAAGYDTNGWSMYIFRDNLGPGKYSWGYGARSNAGSSQTDVVEIELASVNRNMHFTITTNGNTISLYENAVLKTTSTQTKYPGSTNSNFIIGRDETTRYFPGNIYMVRIYNRALSATEVLQNFEATRERFGV